MVEASTAALDLRVSQIPAPESVDLSTLKDEVGRNSGEQFGRWKRTDFTLVEFLAKVEPQVTRLFGQAENRVAFINRWRSFFAVVDWGTLHEMMMFTMLSSKKDAKRLFGHLESVLESTISRSLDSVAPGNTDSISVSRFFFPDGRSSLSSLQECNIKGKTGLEAARDSLVLATILDPTDYIARNNLATICLRLLDDNSLDSHYQ